MAKALVEKKQRRRDFRVLPILRADSECDEEAVELAAPPLPTPVMAGPRDP